jgi:peptide deformylase
LPAVHIDACPRSHYLKAVMIRPLVILPDPVLRKLSKPVETVDEDVRKLSSDMLETMYDAPGIGLAAIQIGIPLRMLVVDLAREDEPKNPAVFINPEILARGDTPNIHEEGCLSIPDYYAEVERPAAITVGYVDLDGKKQEIEAEGMMATVLQHEIDHLDGVLFIDHLSKLKRDMVVRKFKKLAREKDKAPTRMVG